MGLPNFNWSDSDDPEVIRILRDQARQMRRRGSPKTSSTAGKAETLLNEILESPSLTTRPLPPSRPPQFLPSPTAETEVFFDNYQTDTLHLTQGEFTVSSPVFLYDIPLLAGDCVTAILVEGEMGNVSMSDFHLEGALAQVLGARKSGAPGLDPGARMKAKFGPFVECFAAANRRLLIPSGLPSLRPQLRIEAERERRIRFSFLVRRCGTAVMKWPESCHGCKKVADFLLRAVMTISRIPAFELDGFLPDGALDTLCEALGNNIGLAPKPLRELLGPFEAEKTQQFLQILHDQLLQIDRPYDHLLSHIGKQLEVRREGMPAG
jgi:hypothetical protein